MTEMKNGKIIDPLGDGYKEKYTISGQIKLQRDGNVQVTTKEFRIAQLERAIMTYYVKYGERTIVVDNGEQVSVADFIREQLDEDELSFRNETYNKVFEFPLTTEVLRSISDLLKGDYTLSQSFSNDENLQKEDNIGYWLGQLMLDYKISVVDDEVDKLHKRLRDEETLKSVEQCAEILERYDKLLKIQRKVANRLNG